MASNEENARLIVLSVLDEAVPHLRSGDKISLASRIVDCLAEVELIPQDEGL